MWLHLCASLVALSAVVTSSLPQLGDRLHCGSIRSSTEEFKVSLAFDVRPGEKKRAISAILCDRHFRCGTIFTAPRRSFVTVAWDRAGHLMIRANRGALEPDAFARANRPSARLLRRESPKPAIEAEAGTKRPDELQFKRSNCRIEPPVTSIRL